MSNITDQQILGMPVSIEVRKIAVKINDGTTLPNEIHQALISLPEKEGLGAVQNALATHAGINALNIDLPTKAALLAMANLG
jgi:hypothetical protein